MRAGVTSLRKLISRLEQIPQKPLNVAKPNWKAENQKLCGNQRPRTSFRQILRDEIAGSGGTLLAKGRLQRYRHAHDLAYLGDAARIQLPGLIQACRDCKEEILMGRQSGFVPKGVPRTQGAVMSCRNGRSLELLL